MSNAYRHEEGVRESVAQLGHHHACIVFRSLLCINYSKFAFFPSPLTCLLLKYLCVSLCLLHSHNPVLYICIQCIPPNPAQINNKELTISVELNNINKGKFKVSIKTQKLTT